MKLLFKQRMFSWFDSYDVYNTFEETVFTVKGKLSWGHCFKIFNASNIEVGTVKQKIISFLPRFEIYNSQGYVGCIKRDFSFFRPRYTVDFMGWRVEGSFMEWDYNIIDGNGQTIATVSKELLNWTDTYSIDVYNPDDALFALMLVVAIDAEKCSRDN